MQGDHAGPGHVEHSRTTTALGRLSTLRSSSGNKNEQRKITSESGLGDNRLHKTVELLSWVCSSCQKECIPVRSESRCLCGHRLKAHDKPEPTGSSRCNFAKCQCKTFFFIPAEGSWILRCRCKHRHTDHDPVTHACSKSSCNCATFHSPWVCNCNHAWSHHKQVMVNKQVPTVEGLLASARLSDDSVLSELLNAEAGLDVNRLDLINRGNDA
ncbi:TPA: hypothetical protein ACH3X2_006973 [Trebouxia sp. C0005]